ncbi:MAG: hypothetical protein ACJ77M_06740 [Thermoleophilaceae bacterium]
MGTRLDARRAALAAVVAFALAAIALSVLHGRSTPRYPISRSAAVAAARADAFDTRYLARHPARRARAMPLDGRLQRVTFFAGPRVVLDAAVDGHGHVVAREEHDPGTPYAGGSLANRWWLLALMTSLFLAVTVVRPLRSLRNLDALALAAFTADVVLLDRDLLAANVVLSVPLLGYLALRCLRAGTRGRVDAEVRPLLTGRLLAPLAAAALGAFLLIVLSSDGEIDVATASLSGATRLLHWQLPYGHIAGGVVHGDTYPLLNYLLYVPGAAWRPVTDVWSDVSGALLVTALAGVAAAVAMRKLGGLRAAVAWLAFPPVLLAAASGSNDVVVAALLAWLLVAAADRRRSALLLTAAAWTKVVPLVLAPVWLARRDRRREILLPALALSAVLCGFLVTLGGPGAIGSMIHALSFQLERASFFAPWQLFSIEWLQPIAQAAVIAAMVWVALEVRRDPAIWHDPARIAGLCGALLLGLQLSASHWYFLYLPWAFPFVAVALLPSVVRERQPA